MKVLLFILVVWVSIFVLSLNEKDEEINFEQED